MQKLTSVSNPNSKVKRYHCIGLLVVSLIMLAELSAVPYIAARYTIPQIVSESTNVLFGTVTELNTKRKTVKVKVEKNLKGASEFDEIKIRFDVFKGEEDQREELSRFLRNDEPIVICYRKDGGRIDSLGHTRGKWFQTQVTKQRGDWGWWGFTHFEKYLNRDKVSRRDSTPDFQKELSAMLGENALQLLLFNTKKYQVELPVISGINKVQERWIAYQQTTNRELPGLSKANILWLGCRAIGRDGRYWLNSKQEKRIKDFVKNGGIVIASGQDSDSGKPCGSGWLPEPLKGVESSNIEMIFKPPLKPATLFKAPHIVSAQDNSHLTTLGTEWNDKFEVLATTNKGKEIVVAKLRYGKGMYLITSLQNTRKEQVAQNRPMLENLMHFAVAFLEKSK